MADFLCVILLVQLRKRLRLLFCMLDHDVGLPYILSYVIYTRTSHGYRSYAKSSNIEPVLYIQYNPSRSGIPGACFPTTHIFSDYYPELLYSTFLGKEAAYLEANSRLMTHGT
jgi:hypothetical protein